MITCWSHKPYLRFSQEFVYKPTQLKKEQFLFFSFKSFVNSHHPKEILTLDEFFKLREEVLAKKSDSSAEEEDGSDEQPPGEEAPPGVESEGGKVRRICFFYLVGK